MKVLVILGNGYEDLEAIVPIALLRRAQVDVDIYEVESGSIGKFGTEFISKRPLNDVNCEDYDVLFVPGGPHIQSIKSNPLVRKVIAYMNDAGKKIAMICAAPTILGDMGLLKGKHYTCFQSMNEDFGGFYHNQYVVKDGNLLTGLSAAAAEDFGFALLEEVLDEEVFKMLKESIYYKKEG